MFCQNLMTRIYNNTTNIMMCSVSQLFNYINQFAFINF